MIIGVLRWGLGVEVILRVSLEVILHNLLRHPEAEPLPGTAGRRFRDPGIKSV